MSLKYLILDSEKNYREHKTSDNIKEAEQIFQPNVNVWNVIILNSIYSWRKERCIFRD